ncbi:molybdenum ABC transporter ATP-binding protein [Pseudomonas sp. RIT-PI-S]|uniref:molybdenum ABC transporter ATP-binding protein n=1 Tax=Pseudomonas sp. RIT-PI-S TaxID=3035295 RepID=UPI0021DB6DB6|nr:molybdenum ABC transporter ATP-binding protein [Pseudomonas sp. RIT-PI-S]
MSQAITLRLRLARQGFSLGLHLNLPGEGVSAISGPSGSGKTTVLRWLAGLERADEGLIEVAGETWENTTLGHSLAPHRRPIGYVFQEPSLFPHLSVRQNLVYGWRRLPTKQRTLNMDNLCRTLGIEQLLDRRPAGLSGGERQRVGIARALLRAPRLLLMDEPLAALDSERKAEILPYLERLRESLAIPMIYVSHSTDEIARLADHLVLLDSGTVTASGPLNQLLARLDLPLARSLDAGVAIEGEVVGFDPRWQLLHLSLGLGRATLRVAHAERPLGSRLRVRIQARDVSLSLDPHSQSSILNRLPAVVVEQTGDDTCADVMLALDCQGIPLLARLTRYSLAQLGLRPGSAVWAQIKSVAVLA